MSRVIQYLADKVVDVLMYIIISSLIAAVPYLIFTTLSPGIVFLSVAVAAFISMILVLLLGPYVDKVLARKREKFGVEIGGKQFNSELYLTGQLGHLDALLAIPKERLWVMGISLHRISDPHRGMVDRLLGQGVDVRFLILGTDKPTSKELDLVDRYVQATGASQTRNNIVASLGYLKTLRESHRAKLKVRQHDFLPFYSMIVVDDSFIQVGFYLYRSEPPDRPQAIVSNLSHPEIFKRLEKSYEEAWNMAKPV